MSQPSFFTYHNGNVRLQAAIAGPENGTPILLLHGFPEFWYGWRHQMYALAEAGFRVIVPNQRGYDTSDAPKAVADYAMPHLTADVLAIADQAGWKQFGLAGHDWGAAVAWNVALQSPERLSRLMIINVPHPTVMARYLKSNWRQLLRSWYIFFFQLPFLPQSILAAGNFHLLASTLLRSSLPGTFSSDDLQKYRRAWSQPERLRSMINWYRAAARYRPFPVHSTVQVPTKIIWGTQDRFLLFPMATESLSFCQQAELERFDHCTHWVQHEAAEQVNQVMIEFFSPSPA